LLTGGLKSSRFASIQASRFTGGWTFVAPGVSNDADGERVDVSMIERISCRPQRQLSRPPLPVAVILSEVEGSLDIFFCDDVEGGEGIRDPSTSLRMTRKEE
jgi:hypothetical protein